MSYSAKRIPVEDRLIFALDVPGPEQARRLVGELGDSVTFYKMGLQLFMAGGYFELLEWLQDLGKKVFVDLKLFDVPRTVALAVEQLNRRHVHFVSVHGNDGMLEAAVRSAEGLRVLAVTVLTSLDEGDMKDLGFACSPEELVLSRARRALELGCDGIISSGLEAPRMRAELGRRFLVVTPGIRPVTNDVARDDQKRTTDVAEAFRNGADYIVVGRPIRDAEQPRAAAEAIQDTIRSVFPEGAAAGGARGTP